MSLPALQDNLFDPTREVTRTLSNGTLVRSRLRPLGQGRVQIVEYYRKPKGGVWSRRRNEEGVTVAFDTLNLTETYEELFGEHAEGIAPAPAGPPGR